MSAYAVIRTGVSCSQPGCGATGELQFKRNADDYPVKAWLPAGWRSVVVLGEDMPFCPHHAERLL